MTAITVAVLLVLAAVGALLMRRLNSQQNERIATFHYSDVLPGIGRRTRRRRPAVDETAAAGHITTTTTEHIDVGMTAGSRGRHVMAIMHERMTYRGKIMRALYQAAEVNRLPGLNGAKLRDELGIPEQDMAAACAYLVGEGRIVVDWGRGDTPDRITLTHQGLRQMETADEERG
ncbi:hypothetical protein ACWCPM_15995 [Streptomyces sp. NPDC002309]